MGWWGVTAMSGDRPSDILWDFKEVLGFSGSFWDRFGDAKTILKDMPRVTKKINDNLDRLIAKCEKYESDTFYDDYEIGYHVLAIFIMNHGADFPDWLRGQCIECCVNDTWAQEDDERLSAMLSLLDDILEYKDGEVTIETSADMGLMGAIFSKIDSGEDGLVNVGPKKRSIQ